MFQARIFTSALSLIFSSALFADPNLTLLYRKVDDAGKSRLILVPTDLSARRSEHHRPRPMRLHDHRNQSPRNADRR